MIRIPSCPAFFLVVSLLMYAPIAATASVDSLFVTIPLTQCPDSSKWRQNMELAEAFLPDSTYSDSIKHCPVFLRYLAGVYSAQGEHACAIALLEQYRIRSIIEKDYNGAASAYLETAGILGSKGKALQAIENLRKALQLPRLSTQMLGMLHEALHKAYLSRDNAGNALIHGRLAAQFFRRCAGDTTCSRHLVVVLAEIGAIQIEKSNLRDARKLLDEALSVAKSVYDSEQRPEFAAIFLNYGMLYSEWAEYEEALRWYQRALHSTAPDFREKDYRINPGAEILFTNYIVVKVLQGKAEAFRAMFGKSKRQETLEHALACYELSYLVQFQLNKNGFQQPAGFQQTSKSQDQYAIETALELAKISGNPVFKERAFYFAEYSRHLFLRHVYTHDERSSKPAAGSVRPFPENITIATLQNDLLPKDQALIEYIEGADRLFVFILGKTRYEVLTLPLDFPLAERVIQFRRTIEAFPREGADRAALCNQYTAQALMLYQKLFLPLEKAFALPKRLTIIPCGALALLPFEALLSESPKMACDFRSYSYLLQRYSIGYGFAATRQFDLKSRPQRAASGYLGIGPVLNRQEDAAPLSQTLPMLEAVQHILGGKLLLRDEATIAHFKQKAGRFGILQLAAPAQSHNRDEGNVSFILFADGQGGSDSLFAPELYALRLKADLVILNGFEAPDFNSESFMPLANGFFTAGAGSVLSSFWNNDHPTGSMLLQHFFQILREGKTKDEALREAKLKQVEQAETALAHPAFWAGFGILGDTGVSQGRPSRVAAWWIFGAFLAIAGLWLAFYVKKKDAQKAASRNRAMLGHSTGLPE